MRQTKQIESFSPFNWHTELTQNQSIRINRALDCCNYFWHWLSIVSQLPLQTTRFIYEPINDHVHQHHGLHNIYSYGFPPKKKEHRMQRKSCFFALLFLHLNCFYFCLEIIENILSFILVISALLWSLISTLCIALKLVVVCGSCSTSSSSSSCYR